MSAVPTVELNDGNSIPQLGFGVFQIDPAETAEATSRALKIGYRHIDTAEMYRNEKGVGEAVRSSGIPREQIFVTSKLNNGFHRPDDARRLPLSVAQVVLTLTSHPAVHAVRITFDGQPVEAPLPGGYIVHGALTASDYASFLAPPGTPAPSRSP